MIDEAAIAVGLIVEIAHSADAEVGKVVAKFFQIFSAQHFVILAIRAASHGKDRSIFALYSPINGKNPVKTIQVKVFL